MIKILLVAPTKGNGGIASWTNKFLNYFPSKEFKIISVDSSLKHRLGTEESIIRRIYAGLLDLRSLMKEVKATLKNNQIDIMHLTTSGSLGTLRDYFLGRICKKNDLKSIMHCHYGNIPEILKTNRFFKYFLLSTMALYDEIWVLDSKTLKSLERYKNLKYKIFLIPNCIDVPDSFDNTPKTFKKIAFIGNLISSKGVLELIEAVLQIKRNDVSLFIVGIGDDKINNKIKSMSKDYLGTKIQLLGKMENRDAVRFMSNIDILALPTYYKPEAFPISILEAMSLGKLVISTNRAAIPDMLTVYDGSKCGILVEEKNTVAIQNAIELCINHPDEFNIMCEKAYQKVKNTYRLSVVYKICEDRYKNILIS